MNYMSPKITAVKVSWLISKISRFPRNFLPFKVGEFATGCSTIDGKIQRLSFPRCFGPESRVLYRVHIYTPLPPPPPPPPARRRLNAPFDRERFTKFMEAILPRLDLDFSTTGSTRGRPSCVGDHDVSLASCLPGST